MSPVRSTFRTDARAPFWRRLANAQLAATVVAGAYVYAVNGAQEETASFAIRAAAVAFRSTWSYLYVRFFLAPSINRVIRRCPRSRAGRVGASLVEGFWAQLVDAAFFSAIGSERIATVLPFVATNAASIFLSAEASIAGNPPEHLPSRLGRRLRAVAKRLRPG